MKTNTTEKVLIHGHRGSRGTHPENTLPAFREAVDAKAEFLELDMHLSKDDVIFVIHDPSISSQLFLGPNGKKIKKSPLIRELTSKQIEQYTCGHAINERFPEQKLIPNTPIAKLEDVFQYVVKEAPHMQLNIETKMDGPPTAIPDPEHFAKLVINLIKKYHLEDKVILQSFDFRTLEAAKKIEPSLKRSCLFETEKNFDELTLKAGCQVASPAQELVTEKAVKFCHKHNIEVVPWTANTEENWKKLTNLGVDAIITDYPRKLAQFLGR